MKTYKIKVVRFVGQAWTNFHHQPPTLQMQLMVDVVDDDDGDEGDDGVDDDDDGDDGDCLRCCRG